MSERDVLTLMVEGVIAVTLLEALWLAWRSAGTPRATGPRVWAANLLAGLALLLAVRLVLAQAAWFWVAACLAAAGLAHLADLRARWRPASPTASRAGAATAATRGVDGPGPLAAAPRRPARHRPELP